MILPDAAVGSIIAAAIAGLVVFISTVLTKEQKTSDFRQVWIDELRKDIAQFIAGVSEVIALHNFKLKDASAYEEFLDNNFERIHELQTIEHRIVLRLNPIEHETLLNQVKAFRRKMLEAYKCADREEQEEALTKQLLDTTKMILATEWKKVKVGEPTFQYVKWGAFITLVCLLASLVIALFATPLKSKSTEIPVTSNGPQLLQYFVSPGSSTNTKPNIDREENMPSKKTNSKKIQ